LKRVANPFHENRPSKQTPPKMREGNLKTLFLFSSFHSLSLSSKQETRDEQSASSAEKTNHWSIFFHSPFQLKGFFLITREPRRKEEQEKETNWLDLKSKDGQVNC